jgi:hypothetical protein
MAYFIILEIAKATIGTRQLIPTGFSKALILINFLPNGI